jgi:hypothetical protein
MVDLAYTLAIGRLNSGKESFALGTPLLAARGRVASFGSIGTDSGIATVFSFE